MSISIFELFKVGVGPSSSHTVGPMVASRLFGEELQNSGRLEKVHKITIDLHGSLALTGKGHATGTAVLLGLQGESPELINTDLIPDMLKQIIRSRRLSLMNKHPIDFIRRQHLRFNYDSCLPEHPNGVVYQAYDEDNIVIAKATYFSIGGGFVVSKEQIHQPQTPAPDRYEFNSASELLALCHTHQMTIAELMLENERQHNSKAEVRRGILNLWHVMDQCINRGCQTEGTLPGGLNVTRRAHTLYKQLCQPGRPDPLAAMDWVNLFALAVNEQNAAGGRVVTAPTNGAAGVIPAVLSYFTKFVHRNSMGELSDNIITFMLTATAIGILFKKNASISAAEVGCQGEVGVACSMAAAGLTAALGGSNKQIENAAEIGMEHNLGLTCDPIKGLVQIPCIERNTMGAVQAINAARLAMLGDGQHRVSLDDCIRTMKQTGQDMQAKYKETSRGGLAVNVIEC